MEESRDSNRKVNAGIRPRDYPSPRWSAWPWATAKASDSRRALSSVHLADHYPVQGVKFSLRSGADVARLWNVQPHVYQPIELVILRWTAAELDVPRTKYTSKRLETRSREWSRAIYFERPRERGRERGRARTIYYNTVQLLLSSNISLSLSFIVKTREENYYVIRFPFLLRSFLEGNDLPFFFKPILIIIIIITIIRENT